MAKPDLLQQVASKATKKKSSDVKKKNETVWNPDTELIDDVRDLISSAAVAEVIDPVVKQKKAVVGNKLFERWTQAMWNDKQLPPNPRIVVQKDSAVVRDMSFLFMVKFRTNALASFIPKPDELQEDETPESVVIAALTSDLVGLSQKTAEKIVAESGDESDAEFIIESQLNLIKSFDKLYYSKDETEKGLAKKLLGYFNASPAKGRKNVSLPPITDEERGLLVMDKVLKIKDGFMERACSYCENVEQLRNLLRFVKITIVCQNFEFAIGEEPEKRAARMEESVKKFLTVAA